MFDELACFEFGDDAFRRCLLGFGKQHVETEHRDSVAVEQVIDDVRERISRPGPLTQLSLARLIDIDDNDTIVDRARHRQYNANVIKIILDPVDDLETGTALNVHRKEDKRQGTDTDANQ